MRQGDEDGGYGDIKTNNKMDYWKNAKGETEWENSRGTLIFF